MKRIVICIDGTWNRSHEVYRDSVTTNVSRIADSITVRDHDGNPQIVYNDDGIGVHWNHLVQITEGATGYGTANKIRAAYRFLCQNYEFGDEVFLFGFSRGAYAVRSLSNLIDICGIPRYHSSFRQASPLAKAFELYRHKDDCTGKAIQEFREKYECYCPIIKFIGVFDTVEGIPYLLKLGWLRKYHDYHKLGLPQTVVFAFHAVASDEMRRHFQVTMYDPETPIPAERLTQIWYPGTHTDIGGAVKAIDERGMSYNPLTDMIGYAQEAGLVFNQSSIKDFLNLRQLHFFQTTNSFVGFYRLFGASRRRAFSTKHGNEAQSILLGQGKYLTFRTPDYLGNFK